jgi:D-3-phosphoglycerate dehydrogenase
MSETPAPAFSVLVADSIAESGIELLRGTPGAHVHVQTGMSPDQLAKVIGDYDALIVRSATRVTEEVLRSIGRLRVVGRAGTGVDNIDLDAATRAGVVVINTPGGNSVAAAELTLSLLLSMARNVPQANHDLKQGRWERKKYMGVEVAGKTLGVVGLGRIGREVARRARAFRMKVVGYDPYVTSQLAEDGGIEAIPLDDLLARSDFVSLHVPVSDETRHMIDATAIERMKPGARLINCARGGLIDEDALLAALESGRISGAALDVFETEPPSNTRLIEHPLVVSTPHLGASTREAQERVGTEIAAKIRDFIQSGVILDAVNFPSIDREEFTELGPIMDLAERLGSFLVQISQGGFIALDVRAFGGFADHPVRPVAMAATRGLLSPITEGAVSYVNALTLAEERGITVGEGRSSEETPYSGMLRLTLETDRGTATVAGSLFTPDRPRLLEVDGISIESPLRGHLLFFRNRDVPGVVGRIGSVLGRAGVNIAGFQLGRSKGGGDAASIINVDGAVPVEALAEIERIAEVVLVRALHV